MCLRDVHYMQHLRRHSVGNGQNDADTHSRVHSRHKETRWAGQVKNKYNGQNNISKGRKSSFFAVGKFEDYLLL